MICGRVIIDFGMERCEGPFASKSDLFEALQELIEQPDEVCVDSASGSTSTYEISDWSVAIE